MDGAPSLRVRIYLVALALATSSFTATSAIAEAVDEVAMQAIWREVPKNGTIGESGRYFLSRDIATDRETGIKVEADNVTIDLCGKTVRFTSTPRAGTLGIAATGRTGITIENGAIGGFWFGIHCSQNKRLRIHDVHFDDIPYIAINVAQSSNVAITDNVFENFRYDLKKDKKSTYVIGVNIGARDAVIANNRFEATLGPGTAHNVDIETVFVLFSADVTKDCLVTKNDMAASDVLPRSYGVWIATKAQATVMGNSIKNMAYGVCLAENASALVCYNKFDAVGDNTADQTIGITALTAEMIDIKNTFGAVTTPTITSKNSESGAKSSG